MIQTKSLKAHFLTGCQGCIHHLEEIHLKVSIIIFFYRCHCCYSSHRIRTIIKTLLIIIVIVYCTCLKARFTLIWLYGAVITVMLLLVIRMSAIISVCLIWDSRKNPDHLTVGKFGLHHSRLLLYFERPTSSHLTCVNNKCTCFKSPLKMRKAKLFV